MIAIFNERNERKAEAEKDISGRYCEHLRTAGRKAIEQITEAHSLFKDES